MKPTISQIIAISFPAVRNSINYGHIWANPNMNARTIVRPLGAVVEHDHQLYAVEQLVTPIIWSADDETRPRHKNDKIRFVKDLLEDAFARHERDMFARLHEGDRLIVSGEYQRALSEIVQLENGSYVAKLYTAFAVIPGINEFLPPCDLEAKHT